MQKNEFELLEKFIDLKLKRLLLATDIAMTNYEGPAIMKMMFPVENQLEELRFQLTNPKLTNL